MAFRFSPSLALLLPALFLTGCGGSSSTAPRASDVPLSVSAVTPTGLTATLSEDTASAAIGAAVHFTLTLTNNTTQPITFYPLVGCSILANDVGGTVTIRQPSGLTEEVVEGATCAMPAYVGGGVTLAPGKSLSQTFPLNGDFNQLTGPGPYPLTARFSLSAVPETEPETSDVQDTTVGPLPLTVR